MPLDTTINHSRVEPPTTPPLRILLVDQSEAFRSRMAEKLAGLGSAFGEIEIENATTGREAVTRTMERDYDLILMDVEIPDFNGLQACQFIKQVSLARVVILSSLNPADYHRAGRQAGCNHYLTKPPDDADLRVVLRLTSIARN